MNKEAINVSGDNVKGFLSPKVHRVILVSVYSYPFYSYTYIPKRYLQHVDFYLVSVVLFSLVQSQSLPRFALLRNTQLATLLQYVIRSVEKECLFLFSMMLSFHTSICPSTLNFGVCHQPPPPLSFSGILIASPLLRKYHN